MKAIVIRALSAFVLMTLCYLGMAWVINHIHISGKRAACWINPQFQRKGGQEYRLTQDWKTSANYDIVIFGSSHAYRGYDPREFEKFGYNMFTLGSGFQNTMASYVLMENEFPLHDSSVIILDLFDKTFEGDGVGCYTRWIENASYDKTAFEMVWRQPDLRTMNSFACRMFSKGTAVEVPDEEGYLTNGYCPKLDTLKAPPAEMDTTAIRFNDDFLDYLDAFIARACADHHMVILVSHPQPKSQSFQVYHDKFRAFISPVLQKYNLPYLDYNSEHDLNTLQHFADVNHLNQSGVTLFNHQLLTELKARGYLPEKK